MVIINSPVALSVQLSHTSDSRERGVYRRNIERLFLASPLGWYLRFGSTHLRGPSSENVSTRFGRNDSRELFQSADYSILSKRKRFWPEMDKNPINVG